MSKNRLLTILVIALFLLNLVTITALILGRPDGPRRARMHNQPKNIVIERLHLDEAQIHSYDQLIHQHQNAIQEKGEKMRVARNALYQVLQNQDYTTKDSLLEEMALLQKEIEQIHFQHFADLKALCKPEQLKDFDTLTDELARLFAPRRGPGE